MAVTYDVELRNRMGERLSMDSWRSYEDWLCQSLTGSVEVMPDSPHSFYTVVDGNLICSHIRVSVFKFTNQNDALQFKLVFG